MTKFSQGDVVRVKPDKLERYLTSFADRIRDRDAIFDLESAVRPGYYWLEFQKRNGRGKTFRECIFGCDLVRASN